MRHNDTQIAHQASKLKIHIEKATNHKGRVFQFQDTSKTNLGSLAPFGTSFFSNEIPAVLDESLRGSQ
jgi:hypothetical protein